MSDGTKIRVAIIYGGRSSEHEVSLQSARHVFDHLDPERYQVLPVAVDPAGRWHRLDADRLRADHSPALPAGPSLETGHQDGAPGSAELVLPPHPVQGPAVLGGEAIDVFFPVMHGPLCEDGTIQGLFELADVPYVGTGVLGSAVCMDKDVAKRLTTAAGIPSAPYLRIRADEWPALRSDVARLVAEGPGLPVFVKPANMGSSVGITRVDDPDALVAAVETALGFDTKCLIEGAIDAREIELAVLSPEQPGEPPDVSIPGEIVARDGFYDYERKYLDSDGAQRHIPADLTAEQTAAAQAMARQVFTTLECDGMARIDLFLERGSGRLLFNESNTIPGFTTISMYPEMWEASGLPYAELLDRLIARARQRHAQQRLLRRSR